VPPARTTDLASGAAAPSTVTVVVAGAAGLGQDLFVPLAEQLKVHPQRQQRELTPRPFALCAPGRLHPPA